MRWPLVFYTDFGVPQGFSGCARGPAVFIRPTSKGDAGLLAHEMVHVGQWFATLGLHSFLYLLSKRYRLWAEVQAYRVQLEHSPESAYIFALYLATRYRLPVDRDQAMALLRK